MLKQYFFTCDSVMTTSRKLFVFLTSFLTILGCLMFLFSIILPFYYLGGFSVVGPLNTTYWSFKADYFVFTTRPFFHHFWFVDYWFNENFFTPGQGISFIPVAMFTAQALVLAFGIASIHFKKRAMLAAPVCLSVAVLALMSYTGEILAYGNYRLGYYLVFPSLALFLSAFILNEMTKKQQFKDSISI